MVSLHFYFRKCTKKINVRGNITHTHRFQYIYEFKMCIKVFMNIVLYIVLLSNPIGRWLNIHC